MTHYVFFWIKLDTADCFAWSGKGAFQIRPLKLQRWRSNSCYVKLKYRHWAGEFGKMLRLFMRQTGIEISSILTKIFLHTSFFI